MMGIIVAGHQCSGAADLRHVLETHPDIALTAAFNCYNFTGLSVGEHRRRVWNSFLARRNNPFLLNPADTRRSINFYMVQNLLFLLRYLRSLHRQRAEQVTAAVVDLALRSALNDCRLAGDKNHDYVFAMDRLAGDPQIDFVIIIRDPRDVAAATIVKARSVFHDYWPADMRDAAHVAKRWVDMIAAVERNRDQIHVVYYERLAQDPDPSLTQLAAFLHVDGEGFDRSIAYRRRIGEYERVLSSEELDRVTAVAGEAMLENGYDLKPPGPSHAR